MSDRTPCFKSTSIDLAAYLQTIGHKAKLGKTSIKTSSEIPIAGFIFPRLSFAEGIELEKQMRDSELSKFLRHRQILKKLVKELYAVRNP